MTTNTEAVILKFLIYFGTILILCGWGAYLSVAWADIVPWARILITLGAGYLFFILSVFVMHTQQSEKLSTPLLILSAIFQCVGFYIFFDELNFVRVNGGIATVSIYGILFMQYFLLWVKTMQKQNTAVLFFVLLFGVALFLALSNLLSIKNDLVFIVLGISLTSIAYGLSFTRYTGLSPWVYFVGANTLLLEFYSLLALTYWDFAYFIPIGTMIFLSILVRSVVLLFSGAFYMIAYMGYYTAKHYMHSLGWPIFLMLFGLFMLAAGAAAFALSRKIAKN